MKCWWVVILPLKSLDSLLSELLSIVLSTTHIEDLIALAMLLLQEICYLKPKLFIQSTNSYLLKNKVLNSLLYLLQGIWIHRNISLISLSLLEVKKCLISYCLHDWCHSCTFSRDHWQGRTYPGLYQWCKLCLGYSACPQSAFDCHWLSCAANPLQI